LRLRLRAQVRIGVLMEQNAGFRLFNGDRKGILQEAIADANEAVSASAEEGSWATAEAFAVRAQLHFLNEDVARGTEDAKAAYKLDPDILSVALLMAQCHLMNGQTDSAIEVLAASYKQEARPDIVLLYAKTLASRAKQDDLAKAAQVAASVDLGTVPARMRDGFVMNVVQFMVLLKDWSATQEYVQKTKPQLHPVTALALEAHTYLGRGDRDSANRLADEALAIVSGDVQASTKEMFAGLLMQLGRAEDALPIFQELFDKDIPTFDPRQLIARSLRHTQLSRRPRRGAMAVDFKLRHYRSM
jgi:tetratricopeptide (TPR) repeat protein